MSDFLRVTSLKCSPITVRTRSGLYIKLNQVAVGWMKIVRPAQQSIMAVNLSLLDVASAISMGVISVRDRDSMATVYIGR
jgi:hypothetical protein